MNLKEVKQYLIDKEKEGTNKMREKWKKTHKVNSTYYEYYHNILKDCFGMYRNKYLEKYESGKFPKCYTPCPPFYDICNHGSYIINGDNKDKEYKKCMKCFKKFNFTDTIE